MDKQMYKIDIIIRTEQLGDLMDALNSIGVTGLTVSEVQGCGAQKGHKVYYRGIERDIVLLPKTKVEVVVSEIPVDTVIDKASEVLRTGKCGDGKIFVSEVHQVVRIRTGERNWDALQDS